jgi:6-phosphofructokinase 1
MTQNPIHYNWRNFVTEDQRILEKVVINDSDDHTLDRQFLRAGPRKSITWNPSQVRAAIVTCGGLCPGYVTYNNNK